MSSSYTAELLDELLSVGIPILSITRYGSQLILNFKDEATPEQRAKANIMIRGRTLLPDLDYVPVSDKEDKTNKILKQILDRLERLEKK